MLSASSVSNYRVIARTQRSFTYLSTVVIDRGVWSVWIGYLPGYYTVFRNGRRINVCAFKRPHSSLCGCAIVSATGIKS